MSRYLQVLSEVDQRTLKRPDVRPLLHPNWLPETGVGEIGMRTCLISDIVTICEIYDQRDMSAPRIRLGDLEDFRRIWLKNHYGDVRNPSVLRGYWTVTNLDAIGTGVCVIVQYRTLRVCLRGNVKAVVIGTADIDDILRLCVQRTHDGFKSGDETPRFQGTLLYNNQPLQWLLLSVEKNGAYGLEAYIHGFRSGMGGVLETRNGVTKKQMLAVLASRRGDRDFHRFGDMLQRHRIDPQQVTEARAQFAGVSPPQGYEALRVQEMLALFNVPGSGTHDPDPLPLIADGRVDLVIPAQGRVLDLVKQHEQLGNRELETLENKMTDQMREVQEYAIARYMTLLEEDQQPAQPSLGEHLQAAAPDPSAYASHLGGEDTLDTGNLQWETGADDMGQPLNAAQASTAPGGYYKYPPPGAGPSGYQHHYGGHYSGGYGGESSRRG